MNTSDFAKRLAERLIEQLEAGKFRGTAVGVASDALSGFKEQGEVHPRHPCGMTLATQKFEAQLRIQTAAASGFSSLVSWSLSIVFWIFWTAYLVFENSFLISSFKPVLCRCCSAVRSLLTMRTGSSLRLFRSNSYT